MTTSESPTPPERCGGCGHRSHPGVCLVLIGKGEMRWADLTCGCIYPPIPPAAPVPAPVQDETTRALVEIRALAERWDRESGRYDSIVGRLAILACSREVLALLPPALPVPVSQPPTDETALAEQIAQRIEAETQPSHRGSLYRMGHIDGMQTAAAIARNAALAAARPVAAQDETPTDEALWALRDRHQSIAVQIGTKTHGGPDEFGLVCRECRKDWPCLVETVVSDLRARLAESEVASAAVSPPVGTQAARTALIERAKAALEGVTPGPWSAADEHGDIPGADRAWCLSRDREDGSWWYDIAEFFDHAEDAAFCAAARDLIPALLAALESAP